MVLDFPPPDIQQPLNEISILNKKLNTHVGSLAVTKKIRDRAKEHAPVLTGHLRDSIRCWTTNEGATVTAGGVSNLAHPFEGDAGNFDVTYAVYQEFGTYKMSAHPYMRPAIDEVLNGSAFKDAIQEEIKV